VNQLKEDDLLYGLEYFDCPDVLENMLGYDQKTADSLI
jgi:hypothetical protein